MTRRAAIGVLTAGALGAATKSLDILDLAAPKADRRISYGPNPLQFGDLRLPSGPGPHPVIIYIHGGFWKAAYSLEHAGHACAALAKAGAATWNIEYRRIGDSGGGWPGTFDDVRSAARFIVALAGSYPLDLKRVAAAGHSAGGHLALWLAAQKSVDLRAAVSLAGVVDLNLAWRRKLSGTIVTRLLGGSPAEAPDRYRLADPMQLLPIPVKQRLIHGKADDIVPIELSERFAKASANATLSPIPGAGHFELIDPRTPVWKTVERQICNWD